MPAGLAADTGSVAPLRRVQLSLLCALLLCACAPCTGLGAQATSANLRYKHGTRWPPGRHMSCARRASYHGGHVHPRRGHRHSGCAHRRSARNGSGRGSSRWSGHLPAHHSSSCAGADLSPSEQNLALVRAATLCLINREREGSGESPLAANARLERVAQNHSQDMSSADYFDHVGPRGDSPASRMRAAGYLSASVSGYEIGENIAWGTLWLATPRSIVAGWMASTGHRANILDGHFRDTGIGISPHPLASLARGQAGAMYTQDFGVTVTG
jgi:uncharacterized protein YkwD